MTYSEKLKNPSWQKKRLQILERDEFTCLICGDTETELHIHHKEYIKGHEPWDYEDTNFVTACKHCHELLGILNKLGISLCRSLKIKGELYWICFLFTDKNNDKRISVVKIPFDTEKIEFVTGIPNAFISKFYEYTNEIT